MVGRGGYTPATAPHTLNFNERSVRLAGGAQISLAVAHYYRLTRDRQARPGWRTDTAAYFYALDDAEGREILAYHWHPEGAGPVKYPHVHLGAGALVERDELLKAHLPTGRITLPEVLRLVIDAFGVRALRPDWSDVLARTQVALQT